MNDLICLDIDAVTSIVHDGPLSTVPKSLSEYAPSQSGSGGMRRSRVSIADDNENMSKVARKRAKIDERRKRKEAEKRADFPYTCPCLPCRDIDPVKRYQFQGVLRHM